MNTTNYIRIFRGDDSDALGYQTIVGTIKTDLDLTGCKAVFRFLGFYAEFNPIPEDKKLTIVIPAQASRGFPPGVGYASLKVFDSLGKIRTFTNRIPVIVDTITPSCGCGEFEVSFSPFPELEPLKIFIGPNADDFDQYTGFISKIIDRASLVKYGLAILADAMSEDGGSSGKAASPLAVKAAYDAIINELTNNYYNAQQTEEAIDRVAAYYITYTEAGAAFPTYASLANATTVYSGGKVRVPTRNDYCVVLADETHDNAEYRYIYAVAEGQTTGSWQPQFPVEGVMTVDQTVQKNSQNPVSGGGIWSAIWGTASTAFSSLYDWCVSQLAGKQSTLSAQQLANIAAVSDALAFDATRSYAAGDPVVYNGTLYTFTATHTGAWIDSDASAVDIIARLADKADKVAYANDGNLAALDANGNLKDSNNTVQGLFGCGELVVGYSPYQPNQRYIDIIAQGAVSDHCTIVVYNSDSLGNYHYIALPNSDGANKESICALEREIAPAFDDAATYAEGALVYYNDALYRCTTAVTSAGAWTGSTNWTEASVEDVLAALRTAIAGKADKPATFTEGNLAEFDSNGNPTDAGWTAGDLARYSLTTKTITNGAVTLDDRASNAVTISATLSPNTLTINFPTATSGKVRDFAMRLNIAAGVTAPEIAWPQGVTLENDGGEVPEIADGGTGGSSTILYFSETENNGTTAKFLVKCETLTAIAQA